MNNLVKTYSGPKIAPKAILFDFDGVIGKTMEDNFLAWRRACEEKGVIIKENDYLPLEGMKLRDVAKKLCGQTISDENAEKIVQKKEAFYHANRAVLLYPRVKEFLEILERNNIKRALVTAGRQERLEKSVGKLLLGKFNTVIFGDSTERGKPYPDPYLEAASRLGVRPTECIVVENAPLGIRSAKTAGSYCIAITSTLPSRYLDEADEIIEKFSELENLTVVKSLLKIEDRLKVKIIS